MKNVAQLSAYIRFQLAELKSENKHHEFEHLTRWFARKRICDHLLPATGPVSAGGDQGRDFESYRTYIVSNADADSISLGIAAERKLVFACSLQADIEPKIRSDVKTICSGPTKIDDIYFFSEADIPVARRLILQKWARENYSVALEIFDGKALAEELTHPELFWLAEQYLSVPSDMYPMSEGDDARYSEYKARWIADSATPSNYADFFEIKYGLRRATFSKPLKPDLSNWLKAISLFFAAASPPELRRRAIYETCVAALRGHNNLDTKRDLVLEYFDALDSFTVDELRDAATLLFYCSAARRYGHFDIDPARLHDWTTEIWKLLKAALSGALGPGARCSFLQTLGYAGLLPYRKGSDAVLDLVDTFRYWKLLIKEVVKAPLFPLENFADLLTAMTPIVGKDPRFQELTAQVDELLSERTSGFVAAEKCRDRAIKYLDSNQYIAAIKQFHSARVKWFAAETVRGSVLAMMTLAKCYQRLGLAYAGAYYALGAALIAFRADNDGIKRLFPRAVFLAADCYYSAGATISYLLLLRGALLAHGGFARDPGDLEAHEELQNAFAHSAIVRSLAERLEPNLVPIVDGLVAQWSIAEEFKEDIKELSGAPDLWIKTMESDAIWKQVQDDLFGRPFSDLGSPRQISWKALGLTWIVEHENTFDDAMVGEDFAATLQIIAADLADIDLCLLPMTVQLKVALRDGISAHIEEIPDNKVAVMSVQFPKSWLGSASHLDEMRGEIVSVAGAVLRECSGLDDKKFMAAIEVAFEGGLAGKAFSVRPYAELYAEFVSREMFGEVNRTALKPLNYGAAFDHPCHDELREPSTPGPGYTRDMSEKHIASRYERAIKPMRLTLPKLMRQPQFVDQIRKLRAKGYKDWHILVMISNIVTQYRVDQRVGNPAPPDLMMKTMREEANREETSGDVEVPVSIFSDERMEFQDNIMWITVAKTWGLTTQGRTPNFAAYEKLLVSRYGMFKDDVPHNEFFPGA